MNNDQVLTIAQAAASLGVSAKTLRRWEAQGKIVPLRTGGNQRRFTLSDIERLKNQSLSVKKAASQIGVSHQTLRKWDEQGVISSTRTLGNQRRFSPEEVEKLQLSRQHEPREIRFEPIVVHAEPIQAKSSDNSEAYVNDVDSTIRRRFPKVFSQIAIGFATVVIVFGSIFTFAANNPKNPYLGQAQNLLGTALEKTGMKKNYEASTKQLASSLSFLYPKDKSEQNNFSGQQVLQAATKDPDFAIKINVPIQFGKDASVAGTLTAPNILYGITAGQNISITGDLQNPTISAVASSSGGVTSLQGSSGSLSLTAGSGISLSGLTITNSDAGSDQDIFANVKVGSTTISAGSNTDTLKLEAGTGITLTADTSNKKVTINSSSTFSGLTTNGVLYADSATTLTSLTPGTSGYILQSNGSGSAPSWIANSGATPAFSTITDGTNTQAAMVVGAGASLTYSGGTATSGVINANQLLGGTWAAPGSIGSTTPASGAFTTLSASGTLNANGDTVLGDTTSDNITFTGRVAQDNDLIPIGTTGTNDLGSSSLPWDNLYVGAITQNGATLDNTYAPINANFVTVTATSALTGETGIDALTTAISTTSTLNADGASTLNSVTLDANANLILSAGTGKIGVGTTSPLATLDVRGNSGTIPAASVSATSSFASLITDNAGSGALFTASKSGATKFTILNNGNLSWAGTGTALTTLSVAATTAQTISIPDTSGSGGTICLTTGNCAGVGGTGDVIGPGSSTDTALVRFNGGTGKSIQNSGVLLDSSNNMTGINSATIAPATNIAGLTLTGTNVTSAKLAYLNAKNSSGTIFDISYGATQTLTGSLIGFNFDLNNGQVTATNQDVTGGKITLPTVTNTHTSGTKSLLGQQVTFGNGAGIEQNGSGGTTVYSAFSATLPALTQTAGTLTANGLAITLPSGITTGGTANGILLTPTGVGAGTLNGINVGNITAGAGTERALSVGSGWDSVLTVNGTSVINGSGVALAVGGGTGQSSYAVGDILYANTTTTLTKLNIGNTDGYVLKVSSGVPAWGTVSGSSCTTCVITDPSSSATNTIAPTGQATTGLIVKQTSTASPTDDIFRITDSAGSTKYFYVDKDGNVSTGAVSNTTLTLTPTSNTTALTLVGTNVTTATNQYINTKNTSGTIVNLAYGAAQTLSTSLTTTGINVDLSTNVTATNATVTGEALTLPAQTNSHTSGTKAVKGITISSGGGISNTDAGGTTTWTAFDATIPALTQSAGTLNAYGVSITTPSSITTGGTAAGLNVSATGVGAGTLYGLNVGSITAGAGTETAINIGSGWDTLIGGTTAGTNLFSFTNASLTTGGLLTLGGNLAVNGGTITSTGDLVINPAGDDVTSADRWTIGSQTPTTVATLDVKGLSGTLSVASVSANTSFASLIVDNTQGPLFTASSSGVTQFVIRNGGQVGIGNVPLPTAMLDVAGTASISSTLKFRTGTGAVQTTANNDLTIGGDTTGNIAISPLNGSGVLTANATTLTLSGTTTITGSSLATLTTAATLGISATTLNLGGGSAATLGTVSDDNLTITPNGTGNLILTGDFDTQVLIGASGATTEFPLLIRSGIGNNAALVIDNLNSGDLFVASSSGTARFVLTNSGGLGLNTGANNSTLLSSVDLRPNVTNGGTIAVASVSGKTSFAGLVVDNTSATGDIFTASRSGMTKFTIGVDRVQIGTGSATGAGGASTPQLLGLDSKESTGDPSNGRQGDMYYNTVDEKFRCYQGTGWKDCLATSQAEFLRAERISDQVSPEIDNDDHVNFNVASSSAGAAISLDTSSAYTESAGASRGRFTLQGGRTYMLRGSVNEATYSNIEGYVSYRWYDVTNGVYLGSGGVNMNPEETTFDSGYGSEAEAVFSPTTATIVELRLDATSNDTALKAPTSGRYPQAFIQVISGAQEVSATEYLRADRINAQVSPEVDLDDHMNFQVASNSAGSSISLDTTSAYTESAGASRGRFTLAAGKTYSLRSTLRDAVFTDGTSLPYVSIRWYDVTNSRYIGSGALLAATEFAGFGSDNGYQGSAEGIITTTASTIVEVRITGLSGLTSIAGTDGGTFSDGVDAFIQVISDGTKVAQFTGATSAAAGAIGYIPAPVAGQQGALLLGNGTWTARTNAFIGTLLTEPIASFSASTSFAGLIVDNAQGSLFTASSSGLTRFTVEQRGVANLGCSESDALFSGYGAGTKLAACTGTMATNDVILRLKTSDSTGASNEFFLDMTNNFSGAQDQKFKFRTDGTANADGSFTGGGADYAEYFYTQDLTLDKGDLVTLAKVPQRGLNGEVTGTVEAASESKIPLGVVSTSPGFVGTLAKYDGTDDAARYDNDPHYKPIGLTGQVPIKVTDKEGSIKPDDPITTSSLPKYGAKGTQASYIAGRALDAFPGTNCPAVASIDDIVWPVDERGNNSGNPCFTLPDGTHVGKIMIFLHQTLYEPLIHLTDTGNINIFENETNQGVFGIKDQNNQEINRVGVFSDASIANLMSGNVSTQKLILSGQDLSSRLDQISSESANLNSQLPQLSILNSKVASLEAQFETLNSKLSVMNASSSSELSIESLNINGSTVTDSLNVLSYATINELSVTGNITAGLLKIKGLDNGYASINTLNGDLKLQSDGLGGIDILNGKITIDTSGNITTTAEITAKKYNVDTEDVASASLGTITIPAGDTQISASTSALTTNSRIFATPDALPVAISTKKTGSNTFIIKIASPQAEDLKVNWWIVN